MMRLGDNAVHHLDDFVGDGLQLDVRPQGGARVSDGSHNEMQHLRCERPTKNTNQTVA